MEVASGTVLQGRIDDLEVALKWRWNNGIGSAKKDCSASHELVMIEYLLENTPGMFGSVLSRVVAIERKPSD